MKSTWRSSLATLSERVRARLASAIVQSWSSAGTRDTLRSYPQARVSRLMYSSDGRVAPASIRAITDWVMPARLASSA